MITVPPSDDDRTMMPTRTLAQEYTAFGPGNALGVGSRVGEFEIAGVIGEGGFGIIYLAYDHSLHRNIALKEYMPSALAARAGDTTVHVRSERDAETFAVGMHSFINEARLLAHFDHPSLVKVYRFWEANGTAYMAMPFYEGATLKKTLSGFNGPPPEAWLKTLLSQLLEALAVIHREQCFHRDIAPDNILILKNGRALLLDFGAARRVIGDRTQALTVILKPGYAPIEQYAEVPSMKQGAWTDIYALASVMYFAINGKLPVPSVARMISDPLIPLAESATGKYSARFLRGIDKALAVKPEQRPQNVGEFSALLGLADIGGDFDGESKPNEQKQWVSADHVAGSSDPSAQKGKPLIVLVIVLLLIASGAGAYFYWQRQGDRADALTAQKEVLKPERATSPSPSQPPSGEVAAIPEKPLPGAISETLTAAIPDRPIAAEAPVSAASSEPPGSAAIPEPRRDPPGPAAGPTDPLQVLNQILEHRNRNHSVTVNVEKRQVVIDKDPLRFSLRSSKPGYVYLLMVGSDRSHFYLLFPNAIDQENRIAAKKELKLPRLGWQMTASGPPGTNHFLAMVSEHPREFSAASLVTIDPFAQFPVEAIAQASVSSAELIPVFAGNAVCPAAAGANCSESFGAAIFSIDEVAGSQTKPR
ncbi:MAG: DUF4384 domain-containing protein [Burkholderiales bacterium]|nr:DUF4384 domain-containing protein [Burkholderiales bacterium]